MSFKNFSTNQDTSNKDKPAAKPAKDQPAPDSASSSKPAAESAPKP